MKQTLTDFAKLIKLQLTFLVTVSASIAYLIGSKTQITRGEIQVIDWGNWCILFLGGFLFTAAASCFNEVIEVDFDKLMKRTKDRPIPAGRMTRTKGLMYGITMATFGILLHTYLSLETVLLSVLAVILYTAVYTPLKRKSPAAVFFGAIPGALPPMIGYVAAISQNHPLLPNDYVIAIVLFLIQFVWQFPHFWAIAWVADEDYKKAGFRLLPSTKKDNTSAAMILFSTILLVPVSILPTFLGFGGIITAVISIAAGIIFVWFAFKLVLKMDIESARQVMFCSFFYIPLIQIILLFELPF